MWSNRPLPPSRSHVSAVLSWFQHGSFPPSHVRSHIPSFTGLRTRPLSNGIISCTIISYIYVYIVLQHWLLCSWVAGWLWVLLNPTVGGFEGHMQLRLDRATYWPSSLALSASKVPFIWEDINVVPSASNVVVQPVERARHPRGLEGR